MAFLAQLAALAAWLEISLTLSLTQGRGTAYLPSDGADVEQLPMMVFIDLLAGSERLPPHHFNCQSNNFGPAFPRYSKKLPRILQVAGQSTNSIIQERWSACVQRLFPRKKESQSTQDKMSAYNRGEEPLCFSGKATVISTSLLVHL